MKSDLSDLSWPVRLALYGFGILLLSSAFAPFAGESYWQGYWISVLWLSGCAAVHGILRFIYREFLQRR
ncbi:NADPH oxidase [Roseibium sp. TrichSKD4]|nr:NADPH oxidase [Roseibium sp. TrichSKD4]